MPSTKRLSDEVEDVQRASKAARIDTGDDGGDIFTPGKRKSATSNRTGQACDRCKVRKIRCDARPGGCSPCLQNNTECKTTDRITGRATSRGHTENLENENAALKMYLVELQQQLRDEGIDPKPPPNIPAGYTPAGGPGGIPYWQQASAWEEKRSGYLKTPPITRDRHGQGGQGQNLPDFRTGCIGDNYLGVSSENNWLTPVEGMSVSLFGMNINLSDLLPAGQDQTTLAISYQTFLKYSYNKHEPFDPPSLPPYEQCRTYAEWFFRTVGPFIPILHKPDFFALLDKIMKEDYRATPAETAMVHGIIANVSFQYACRNANAQAREEAFRQYHYCLTLIPDLIMGHTLADIQALTVICTQLRSFPRPGAAWIFARMVLNLAIEMGLHRSAKAWQGDAAEKDPHVIEMRKRTFWCIMVFNVVLSGKLGRPMPLRPEDFDIEIPEPLHDCMPNETNLSKHKKCSFRAGIQGMKLLKIMMSVYSTIYPIQVAKGMYEINVRALEKEIEEWRAQVEPELSGGPQTKDEDRVFANYLEITAQECELLIHHPSLCRSGSPQVLSSNLDACLAASDKLLEVASQLKTFKSLDTTWDYSTGFLAAIFTTLFAMTERRASLTQQALTKLRHDMDLWLDIMGDIGQLLGIGLRLQNTIRSVVDFTVDRINKAVAARTASAAVEDTEEKQTQMKQEPYTGTNGYHESYERPEQRQTPTQHNRHTQFATQQAHVQTQQHTQQPIQQQQPQQEQQAPYPSGNNFNYPDPTVTDLPNYSGLSYHDATELNEAAGIKPGLAAQLMGHTASISHAVPAQQSPHPHMQQQQQTQNFLAPFQSPPPQQSPVGFHAPSTAGYYQMQPGPAAWRDFADNMMTNFSGQEQYAAITHSMGASMTPQLHTRNPYGQHAPMELAAAAQMNTGNYVPGMNQQWPLLLYNGVLPGNGSGGQSM